MIDDIADAHYRYYIRSKTYLRRKWLTSIWGGVISLIGLLLVNEATKDTYTADYLDKSFGLNSEIWWIYTIAHFWLANSSSNTPNTACYSTREYIKREYANKLPATTKYLISDSKLKCSTLGTEISFDLKNLSEINEDSKSIELVFHDSGLCVIPHKAFETNEHKNLFLKSLKPMK